MFGPGEGVMKSILKKILGKGEDEACPGGTSLDIWKPVHETFAIGFAMVGSIVTFMLCGWLVDSYFETGPVGLIVGMCLGVAGGFWYAYRLIMKAAPEEAARHPGENKEKCKNTSDSATGSSK